MSTGGGDERDLLYRVGLEAQESKNRAVYDSLVRMSEDLRQRFNIPVSLGSPTGGLGVTPPPVSSSSSAGATLPQGYSEGTHYHGAGLEHAARSRQQPQGPQQPQGRPGLGGVVGSATDLARALSMGSIASGGGGILGGLQALAGIEALVHGGRSLHGLLGTGLMGGALGGLGTGALVGLGTAGAIEASNRWQLNPYTHTPGLGGGPAGSADHMRRLRAMGINPYPIDTAFQRFDEWASHGLGFDDQAARNYERRHRQADQLRIEAGEIERARRADMPTALQFNQESRRREATNAIESQANRFRAIGAIQPTTGEFWDAHTGALRAGQREQFALGRDLTRIRSQISSDENLAGRIADQRGRGDMDGEAALRNALEIERIQERILKARHDELDVVQRASQVAMGVAQTQAAGLRAEQGGHATAAGMNSGQRLHANYILSQLKNHPENLLPEEIAQAQGLRWAMPNQLRNQLDNLNRRRAMEGGDEIAQGLQQRELEQLSGVSENGGNLEGPLGTVLQNMAQIQAQLGKQGEQLTSALGTTTEKGLTSKEAVEKVDSRLAVIISLLEAIGKGAIPLGNPNVEQNMQILKRVSDQNAAIAGGF